MFANAFLGQPAPPTPNDLARALGATQKIWDRLVADLRADLALDGQEWNQSSKKAGWALRLKRKDRNVVYLSPGEGGFLASFALGDKAMAAARALDVPAPIRKILDEAKRYAEGSAVRIEVHGAADAAIVKQLAAIKIAN